MSNGFVIGVSRSFGGLKGVGHHGARWRLVFQARHWDSSSSTGYTGQLIKLRTDISIQDYFGDTPMCCRDMATNPNHSYSNSIFNRY
jgi:hypothetical protein